MKRNVYNMEVFDSDLTQNKAVSQLSFLCTNS